MTAEESADATRTLDAREIEGEPFGAITDALEDLDADESVLLVNSFEPEPLYGVLDDRGFDFETDQVSPDEWHVRISHAGE
jgi:uncharacterized protein (DUF2249 family)